ncbi:MAG: hypothetical protein ACE5GQ_02650 [Nitrospinales bacterium]
MNYFLKRALIVLAVLFSAGVVSAAGKIKLYLDYSRIRYVMADPQDCSVHGREDKRFSLGFKAGLLFFGIGPEIAFGKKSGVDWDQTAQALVARYQELCARFNTGALTKQDYDERLARIEAIEKEAYELRLEFLRQKERHRQSVFDEMDREAERFSSFRSRYDLIRGKLDAIAPRRPKPPTGEKIFKPSDIENLRR